MLRCTLQHEVRDDLAWNKDRKLFYFRALEKDQGRIFAYDSAKKRTAADVVNVSMSKKESGRVGFVRHHAFEPRFELLGDQWFLVINPTYYFTTNGFTAHAYPAALLAGKKRMDNSASLRGQVIMWHRALTKSQLAPGSHPLFAAAGGTRPVLTIGDPPKVQLDTRVPEDVWGTPKSRADESENQIGLFG